MTLATIRAALGNRWPVAEGPGWLLVHGDCLDVMAAMPDGCVQVVLTDPPYEAEAHELGKRQNPSYNGSAYARGDTSTVSKRVVEDGIDFAAITDAERDAAAVHFARIATHRALAFCQAEAIGPWRQAFNDGGIPYRRAMPWTKPDAMPSLHGRWPGQAYESIVLAQYAEAPTPPVGGKAVRYEYTRCRPFAGIPVHPTTKPLPLMLAMVEDFTDPGDLVLDAFAGSATTGVACLRLGRQFIGIERDPAYFEIACRRMRGDEAKPRAEQPGLFDTRSA